MSLKIIISLVALVLQAGGTAAQRPHIITVMIDDWGYHDIGYHGAEFELPNIELLANSGIKLENYYCHSVCSPTRSAFFTGRQDAELGIQTVLSAATRASVPGEEIWFTEELRDLGYKTHMIGKWHIGYYTTLQVPTGNEFDTFFGVLQGRTEYFTHQDADVNFAMYNADATCDGEPYDLPENIWGGDLWEDNTPVWVDNQGNYTSILFADRAVKIIGDHYESGSDAPLYINLAFTAVHNPWQAPKYAIESEGCDGVLPGDDYNDRRILCGMLQVVDAGVGNIIEALKAASYLENTLILVTSDNGGAAAPTNTETTFTPASSNYPLRAGKSQYFEGGVRVTGILWGNPVRGGTVVQDEIVGDGIVSESLVHVSDWFLTFQAAAGGNPPDLKATDQAFDGTQLASSYNQWDHLAEGAPFPRDKMLVDIMWPQDPIFGAVRDLDYKLFLGSQNTKLDGWFDASDLSHNEPICGATYPVQCPDADLPDEMFFKISADPNERFPLDISNLNDVEQDHYDDLKLYIQRWASLELKVQMLDTDWYAEGLPNFWGCSWAPFLPQDIDINQPSIPVSSTGNCKDTPPDQLLDCGEYPGDDDWLNYYDIPDPWTTTVPEVDEGDSENSKEESTSCADAIYGVSSKLLMVSVVINVIF